MNERILFFDDEEMIAKTMQNNLKLFGFDITLISSIGGFLEEIKSNTDYDLVIMDVMAPMPSDDIKKSFTAIEISNMANGIKVGEVLMSKIRKVDKYANIPILIYSARPESKAFKNSKYIRKPDLARNINDEIENLLNKKLL